ncbi:MAG: hypothetical protein KatS3mg124_0803 [Porticoccaceae bacterium]|nr:MAG: hypothetical protein KatS3mg124_0803 [Porticoccaceae bacterium]
MDLSTGRNIHETREWILRNSPVPIGTVPIYQALEKVGGKPRSSPGRSSATPSSSRPSRASTTSPSTRACASPTCPLTAERVTGIVSRGGSIIAKWCLAHHRENFLYTHFEEICEILRAYDVAVSLGDGLRPGSIADANDEAQFAELKTLGELTRSPGEYDVQVMIEGPGHVPMQLVRENVDRSSSICHEAPFYTLGPLVTDIAPGYDHIASAIGAAHDRLVRHRHALLRHPQGAPGPARAGRTSSRDSSPTRSPPTPPTWPRAIRRRSCGTTRSPKRASSSAGRTSSISRSDPETARAYHDATLPEPAAKLAHFCSMCGPKFCSMQISQEIRDAAEVAKGLEQKAAEFVAGGGEIWREEPDAP